MKCGEIVTKNICTGNLPGSPRCVFSSVTYIEVKATTTCSATDITLLTFEEYSQPFPQLDPATVGKVFSIGFTTVLLCYLIARGVGVVLNLIRTG